MYNFLGCLKLEEVVWERTEGPIPVWCHSGVAALLPQRVFEMLDQITMPWQKHSSEVDLVNLGSEPQSLSELAEAYDRVKVHV